MDVMVKQLNPGLRLGCTLRTEVLLPGFVRKQLNPGLRLGCTSGITTDSRFFAPELLVKNSGAIEPRC
jgi:hypothetical protein